MRRWLIMGSTKILFLDFECDEHFFDDIGAGWPLGLGKGFNIIGCAFKDNQHTDAWWETDVTKIKDTVERYDTLVCHNAMYDLGILHSIGCNLKNKTLRDTMLMAKLYDNSHTSYSLDNLSKRYLNSNKDEQGLIDLVIEHQLVPIKTINELAYTKAKNYAKKNLQTLYEINPEVVEKYATVDVELCSSLYNIFMRDVDIEWLTMVSKLLYILIEARDRGVRVDLRKMRQAANELTPLLKTAEKELRRLIPVKELSDINLRSGQQLAMVYDIFGIKYNRTKAGNPSLTKEWLSKQNDKFSITLLEFRKLIKNKSDFIDTVLEVQEKLGNTGDYGRIYPNFNIFGATATGRFSCSKPNIQQIPSRGDTMGDIIRNCYVPEEGEMWASFDYSSQEPRLQVHDAVNCNARGASTLQESYKADPSMSLHEVIAKMTGLEKHQAKIINLGVSYGMGNVKLANALGVSIPQAKRFREQYNSKMPYLLDLATVLKNTLTSHGHIKTLLGRKLMRDVALEIDGEMVNFDYKAINKRIQGSAADQTIKAIVDLYDAGFRFLFTVHDEINFSLTDISVCDRIKEIMETCVDLHVPSYVEYGTGLSWGEAK